MEKKLPSQNILSNVQENTPTGVLSFSSLIYNRSSFFRKCSALLFFLAFVFWQSANMFGQVALITASNGGFENATSAFTNNGWTAVGTSLRTWRVGTLGAAATGTKAAFWGTATAYGGAASSAVGHFYRDIAIPAGATNVYLNYKLKYPTVDNTYDYFYVFTTTTANTPANAVIPTTGYTNRFTNTATVYAAFTAMPQVDLTALAGTTVRLVFTFKSDAATPNAAPVVDDITLTYIAGAGCTGTPAPGATVATPSTVASGNTSVLTLSTPPTGTGLTYQWQSAPTSTGTWANVTGGTGATTASYTTPALTTTTWYRCNVTCGASTGTSTAVQVTVNVANNIPLTGSSSVACGTSTLIYDNGGSAGNYGTSASGYIVLNNAVGSTSVITLSGTYSGIETCCDNFKIYSGSGIGGTLLYTYGAAGAGTIATFSSAAGQTITIQFNSDGSIEGAGIALNAVYSGSCTVPPCSGTPAPGATIATPSSVAPSGTSVLTLTTLTTGSGVTYQWQSSATSGGTYANVTGGTGATTASYTTPALSTSTWYRCLVTCGANTGTSTPVQVQVTYCTPPAYLYACGYNYTANVTTTGGLTNFANTTACTGPLTNYSATISASQLQGGVVNMSLLGAYSATAFSVWIDYNDNFVFEATEKVITLPNAAGVLTAQAASFTVPASAPSGTHRMRVRCEWNGVGAPTDPCTQGQYGETEDYGFTVIVPSPPVVSSFSPTTICPGNTVTITGSNFYGVTGVTINGVTATYTVVSATSITATVPATTSGTIAITSAYGTGTSAGTLTINSAPATPVISVSPSASIGLGATATLTATTTGGTINWYKPMGTLVGTGTTFTTPAACTAGTHTYYAQEAGASCPSVAASQIITVNPLVTSTPSNGIICSSGGSVTLNANVTGGTGFNWSPATGLSSTTAGITIASPTVTTAYTFTCTTTACGALSGTFNVGVIAPTAYTPTATPATLCTGATSLLASNLASAGFTYATTPFSMSTSASPVTLCSGGVQNVLVTSGNLDDGGWQNIPLGFSYNFFGSSYSSVNVGTNGVIQFGAYNSTSLGDYTFATPFPTVTEPTNVVAAAANDYYASVSGQIRYWTEGISPTRVFVIEWNAVPGFTTNGSMTSQIKLYETTGNVEVHIGSATSTNNKVVGLQNVDATIGATAYSSATVITNTAWKFIPGAAYGFQWSTAGAAIGGATSTTYTTPILTTPGPIVYTVSALNPNTGCATNNNVTVTVNASPAAPISGGTVTNCSNITPQTLTATAPIGCVVDWYGAPAPFGGSNPVLLSSSSTYSTSTAGTYYAVSRNTITGCTSGGTAIQYIQTPAPALPTATTAIAYCQGAIASALSATALAGNSINWYNSMGGAPYTVAPIPSTVTSGATNYWAAQVSGTNGCVSNLLMITVTVNPSPAAPVAAAAGPYCQNDVAAALSATADAGNTLQWYTAVGGTASSTAITPSTVLDGTTDYYVAQLSAAGCISPLTTLSVLVNPTLTASVSNSASSTSACGGAAITFTAIPANGGSAPTYQWYVGGVSQPGETGTTYTIASPVGGEAVYVEMISNAAPCLAAATVVSNTVTLTTTPSTPSVTIAVIGSSTICFGSPITFSVSSSSSLGATPYYQWQMDGVDVAGENGSTFTTVDLYPFSYVSLNVSSSILPTTCLTVVNTFSNSIYPTILEPVIISPDPSSVSACLGTTQTFTVGASGSGTFTYQWQKDGVNITGNPTAITSTLTVSPVAAGSAGVYACVVTGTCGAVTSAGATLTIEPNTAISAQPVAVTQCEAGLVTFTVTASGAGTLSYQWRKNGTNIVGANSASYSIAAVALSDAGNYSVVVGGTCGSVTSVNALLTVSPSITITSQPVSLTLCAGATANFSVTASGTGTLTYKWRFNGVVISGAPTISTYSIPSITAANAGNYTVSIISSCGTVLSTTAVLTVNPVTAIVTQPVSVTPCIGTNTMFFVAATGTGTLTYQWKLDGVNIPSSNNDTLNISSVSSANAGTYSCVVSGGTCGTSSATSSFATLTTIPLPTVTTANTAIICSGSPTAISLTASAASSFAWTVGTITGTITGASAGSGASIAQTLTNPSSSTAGTVQFIVTPTSTAGSCAGAAYTITVTVNPASTVTTANTAAICSGTPTAISLTASGPSTFAWTVGAITGSITGASAGSGTSIAQTLTNPSSSTAGTVQYIVTPTATTGGCAGAPYTITVTVNPTPAITCPAPITVAATAGSCTATVSYVATSTTPGATITYSIASGSAFSVGTTSVTATATSVEGCLSTCTFNVIVTSSGTSNWIGGTSTDWFNSANWCGGVPTSTSNVTISLGSTFLPLISTTGAVCRNLTINAGATLAMNGNAYLTVSGNWVNSGTFTAIAGEVSFAGSAAQTLSGATSFINFTLNNAAGLTSSSTITINGICQLTAGVLTTGTNIVIISSGAYVIATAGYVNGYLRKSIATGSSISESFEIGSATAYTPTTLYFNSVSTAGTLTVNTVTGDHGTLSASGFNASRTINRYWKIVNAGVVFDYYDLDVNYATADMDAAFSPTFAGAKIYVTPTTVSPNAYSANYGAPNFLNFVGITEFGEVQIGVFNPVPVLSSVTPDYAYITTTSNLVVTGQGFIAGAGGSTVNALTAGVTINSTTVTSDTTLTLNITVSPTATLGVRSFAVTNPTPFGGVSDSLTITIRKKAVASFYANRTTIGCYIDGNVEFMNYSTDAVSYLWNFGAGATPGTATGAGPYTVLYSSTGLKTITLTAYSPIGDSTLVRTNYINVTNVAPLVPTSISGPTSVCSSGSNKMYSIPLVAGVTSYTWNVPTGATIVSGATGATIVSGVTRTIYVQFASTYTTGTITVIQRNACGDSPPKSLVVAGLPVAPASITGPTNICSLTSATYTVSAVTGATSYTWSLPMGVTTASGASNTTTTGTTLTVYFAPSPTTGGNISVYSTNVCSSSASISLSVSGTSSLVTPATLTGPTSTCGLSTGTYTVSAVTGAASYEWTLPTGVTPTSGTSPITTTGTSLNVNFAGTISGNISVVALNTCTYSSAKTLAISNTVATPASVTGPTNICGITSGTYTVSAVTGATSYLWTLPAGVTSAAAGPSPITTSTNTLTVTYGLTTSGTITVAAVGCSSTSSAVSIAFFTSGGSTTPPATPGVISGPTAVCNLPSTTYSIVAVAGATNYTWTLPTGITCALGASPITTTSTSITVSFASFTSGSISVKANSCSSSAARTLALTTVPAVPATLTGTTIICGAATSYTYTVGTVASATSYIWTLPAGVSSGGVSTSVTVPAAISGPNTITLDFAPTFVSGIIYVKAYNTCGTSINKALSLTTTPLTPGVITGPAVVGSCLTTETYSIAAVAGASSYLWTLPSGFTLATGSTGFTNTITVDIAVFTGGTLSVVAVGCGNSPARTLAITTNVAIPASITGLLGVCGLTTATYTVAATTGAASYTWTLPTGVTHASGTNPVTIPAVTTGTNTIVVNFDLTTFVSGILSVNANSSCGVPGLPRSIVLNVVPVTPATLTGSTFVCGVSSATYTVSAVSGASGYTWYLPANANSGGVIDSVTTTGLTLPVTFTAGFTSGNLSVKAKSPSCGSSLPKTITISTAPITPVTLSGATNICNLSSTTYTVSATANAVSYTWTLPTGVTSTLGSSPITILAAIAPATNTITVNFAATSISGSISVTANSSCASSAPKTLALTGVTAPATPTAISGSAVVCWGTPVTYTATAVVGAISYDWTLPTGVTSGGTGGVVNTTSNSITLDFDGAFVSGSSIAVKANNRCTTSAVARTLALTTVIGTAGVITGQTSVCGLDSATYTVAATVGATSYIWTLPAGITHWSGTYPVLVTGSNTITVVFATTFTSGSLSVKAKNACATSVTARTLALTKVLATPGAFTGLTNVCGVASTTYSVAAVTGATGYKWTVPVDMTITSGLGTNSINVTISSGPGATLSNYTLSVKDTNACGESAARSMTVSNCHSYIAFSADSSDITNLDILLYPNPSLGTFNIEYNSVIKSQLKIEMYDVLGKLVFEKSETIVEGENVFRYNEEGVQKGSYFIKLTDEQNKMFISKILVVQ